MKFTEVELIGGKPPKPLLVRYMALTDILSAGGLCQVFRDRYWIMHPEHGIAFGQVGRKINASSWGPPMCNGSIKVADKMLTPMWEGHRIIFIPMVIVPSSPSEWS